MRISYVVGPAVKTTVVVLKTMGRRLPGDNQDCTPPLASHTVAEMREPTFASHQMPSVCVIRRNRRCRYGLSSTERSDSRPTSNGSSRAGRNHSPQYSIASSVIAQVLLRGRDPSHMDP